MTSLISPELGQLLALRRVHRGHMVLVGRDHFLDHGRRIPGYLHAFLHDLLADGYLCLGEQGEGYDQRPVLMTTPGTQLHHTLENAEDPLDEWTVAADHQDVPSITSAPQQDLPPLGRLAWVLV